MNPHSLLIYATSLLLTVSVQSAVEIESNNTKATANPIIPGQGMTGQLASESDEDWFGFSASSSTIIRVMFDSPENLSGPAFGYHTIEVRNSAGDILSSVITGADTFFYATLPSAGTYYVVVLDGPYSFLSTGQYVVEITTTGTLPTTESEPNDNFSTSTPLTHGNTTWGQLSSENDEDWLAFSISGPATVTIVFDSPESLSGPAFGYHTIQVKNAAGTVYASVDTGEDKTFLVGLPAAGEYFVVVKDGPYTYLATKMYSVTLTSTTPPTSTSVEIQSQIHTAVEITWDSSIGKSYVVEWTADLSQGSWFPLTSSTTGTGNQMNHLDSISGESKGFYRIKEF